MKKRRITAAISALLVGTAIFSVPEKSFSAIQANAASGNVLEYLDRGISAIGTGSGMLVSWRYLANDDDNAVYRLYRNNELIYTSEAGKATCFLDEQGNASSQYRVETLSGDKVISSETCQIISENAYLDIPLEPPTASGVTYTPNDMSVGDVDGDGQYELFLKWDPSNSKDNSQKGKTDKVYIDCLCMNGERLWRIDLGWNIRAGAHYTQFFVGDFDLDGKCEMTCKTSDGTVDGTGKTISDASAVYRDGNGFIYTGNEYYTLFDGATGAALDTIDYEPGRGDPTKWGKSSDKTNRVDRFWGTVAYLDGVHPCIVTGRGYYGRMTAVAYTVEEKKLKKLWMFDTGTSSSTPGYGDGNHNSMPADVDSDGKQEIITGSTCIDDDGTLLWCLNKGHGDAMHVGDLDPTNPGIEAWICHEDKPYGVSLVDCDTGNIIFHNDGQGDTGRCCGDNVWAGNPGAELWGNKEADNSTPVKNISGETLSCRRPAINFLSYWDGDLEREILDGYTDSPATITKMQDDGTLKTLLSTDGYYTCNTTKGTPCLSADIFGDWREELIVRAADSKSIRIYATTYTTDYRITTLMHDAQYRMQVSAQNTAYNQPPHTSFFLGTGYDLPKRPENPVNSGNSASSTGKIGAVLDTQHEYYFTNVGSGLRLTLAEGTPEAGTNVQQGGTGIDGWFLEDAGNGYYRLYSEAGDGKTYLLDLDYGKTENGTNIRIWGDTASDAQLFKFVDNGDGTYTITTKATSDESCLGVEAGSKESGANVLQWACDGSENQKWTVSVKIPTLNGKLFQNLQVQDETTYSNWKIDDSAAVGDFVFGDREVLYTEIPENLLGAEMIQPACDAKFSENALASFTAGENMTVYVAMDNRVTTLPEWLSDWEKTGMTLANDGDVVFDVYQKNVKAGDVVTLGANGQSAYCVNYTVFAKANSSSEKLKGDANGDGEVNLADAIALQKWLLTVGELPDWENADMNGNQTLEIFDLVLLKRQILTS